MQESSWITKVSLTLILIGIVFARHECIVYPKFDAERQFLSVSGEYRHTLHLSTARSLLFTRQPAI